MRPICVYCGTRIDGAKIVVAKPRGYRHPDCEKSARDRLPDRPLTATEAAEKRDDDRELRRHSSDNDDTGD